MANLGMKSGNFVARFRHMGREYKKSLKTRSQANARAAMHRVEDVLHRLAIGLITVPEGVDPGDFIVSGGTLQAPKKRASRPVPTLAALIEEYMANLNHIAESNRCTIGVHLRQLKRKLASKAEGAIDRVEQRDLAPFCRSASASGPGRPSARSGTRSPGSSRGRCPKGT